MRRTDWLLILQGLAAGIQVFNAGAATYIHNPLITLGIGSIAAMFSFVVQHIGNQTVPMPEPQSAPSDLQDPPKGK